MIFGKGAISIFIIVCLVLVGCSDGKVVKLNNLGDKIVESEGLSEGSGQGKGKMDLVEQEEDYLLEIYLDSKLIKSFSIDELKGFHIVETSFNGIQFEGPHLIEVLDSLELDLGEESILTFTGISELTLSFSEAMAEDFILSFTKRGLTKLMATGGNYNERDNWVPLLRSIHIEN